MHPSSPHTKSLGELAKQYFISVINVINDPIVSEDCIQMPIYYTVIILHYWIKYICYRKEWFRGVKKYILRQQRAFVHGTYQNDPIILITASRMQVVRVCKKMQT